MQNVNIFEHYFVQPYGLDVEDVKQSKYVILDKNSIDYGYYDVFAPGRDDDYMITDEDFYKLAQMQKKIYTLGSKDKGGDRQGYIPDDRHGQGFGSPCKRCRCTGSL